jgi:hypothetical protein
MQVDALFLTECRDRLRGLIEGCAEEKEALTRYFDVHGAEHSQDECPQDDTCDCAEHVLLHAAWERMGREIELAWRRIDKLNKALADHQPTSGEKEGASK